MTALVLGSQIRATPMSDAGTEKHSACGTVAHVCSCLAGLVRREDALYLLRTELLWRPTGVPCAGRPV